MSPAKVQAILQEALAHHQAGRLDAAVRRYGDVRKLMPAHAEAHHWEGVALLQLGRPDQALPLLRRAAQLNPRSAEAHLALGLALGQTGRPAEGATVMLKAAGLSPDNPDIWTNLASLRVLEGQLGPAADAYQECIRRKPNHAAAHAGLGSVLQLMGKFADALQSHDRALQLDPAHPKARLSRGQSLQSLHRVDEALASFTAQVERFPDDLEARSYRLFLLNYSDTITREELFAEHRAFGQAAESRTASKADKASANAKPKTQNPKLRVAFLSPDLRRHSVAYFLAPLLDHLDPARFEVVLYHDHFTTDEVSHRLKARSLIWRNFVGQTHDQVERQVRADAPDVVVDLAGHSGSNRLPLFARRIAPVQITYLGYPNTTGLTAMDYRFTDALADPEGDSEALHTEALCRFAPTAWAYAPPEVEAPVQAGPTMTGQPFSFGSFNNLSKVSPTTLRLWAEVLRVVPEARLVLKSFGLEAAQMTSRLEEAGIPPSRVLLLPAEPTVAGHLAAYRHIDVALDTFPYHGTTTTCEALWMGVPVLSLQGDRHASRVGKSLLSAVGHPEWAVSSPADFVARARALAEAPERLAPLRSQLRSALQGSPLMDHRSQARRFGDALRQCWEARTGGRLPIAGSAPTHA